MARALSSHLTWTDDEAARAAFDLSQIEDHPGLEAVKQAVEQKKLDLLTQLLVTSPTEKGADYAAKIGEIRALDEFPLLVQGITERGRRAEQAIRAREEEI